MAALQRLTALRNALSKQSLSAYIVPTADAHQSEYVADCDTRRTFISDFAGSAGTAVVSMDKALLWTDGRYFLQAEKQLDNSCWELMKQGVDGVPSIPEWVAKNLPSGSNVGFNPFVFSVSQYRAYSEVLAAHNINLVGVEADLVDSIWTDKPALPKGTIKVHPVALAGESTMSKVEKLRAAMKEKKATSIIVCALDEVAWLFNLRGSDISFNPVFFSYAMINEDEVILYVDEAKFDTDVLASLEGITIKPYDNILADVKALNDVVVAKKDAGKAHKVWMDATKSNIAIFNSLTVDADQFIIDDATPITLNKAIKNDVEIEGMKNAHIRDGVAMVRFLNWFEEQYASLPEIENADASPLDEFLVAEKLASFRAEEDKFVTLSFDTISSVGPNGAVIHYKPEADDCAKVTSGNIYLLDSGGQYLDGTTDITRTFYIPSASRPAPSDFEKETYTRVLMGHASLAAAIFPPNTMGPALDSLARQWLWAAGLNFMHGTGHGVGSYLNVHEGPQGIAMMNRGGTICKTAIVPGMVVSNEPGYYHDGSFGIRIENLVYTLKKQVAYGEYYGFEDLTCVPIDTTLINTDLLLPMHKEWLNNYHAWVRATLVPLLDKDEGAKKWVIAKTEPLA